MNKSAKLLIDNLLYYENTLYSYFFPENVNRLKAYLSKLMLPLRIFLLSVEDER